MSARRVLEFPLSRIAVGLVATVVLIVPALILSSGATGASARGAVLELYTGFAAGAALWLVGRFIERRSLAEIGLPIDRRLKFVVVGFAFGGAIACVSVGILWILGAYLITGSGDLAASGTRFTELLVFELGSAALQVILFYGIVFRVLAEWLGRWPAIAIAVVLFGAIHLTGANATVLSTVVIGLTGGALLAVSYLATGSLWLPMGILWGVNFLFAEVLGAIPSSPHVLVEARLSGPVLLTGGAAGAESGGATLVVVAIAIVIVALRSTRFARRVVATARPSQ